MIGLVCYDTIRDDDTAFGTFCIAGKDRVDLIQSVAFLNTNGDPEMSWLRFLLACCTYPCIIDSSGARFASMV